MLSLVPGGYIVRETTLGLFLMNEGIPINGAILVTLFDRMASTIFSVLIG